jgi:hypothetical protein
MTETSLELVTSVTEDVGSQVVERLRFRLPDGSQVRGFLTRPVDIQMPRPAIRYEIGASELGEGGPALLDLPGRIGARMCRPWRSSHPNHHSPSRTRHNAAAAMASIDAFQTCAPKAIVPKIDA